MEQEQTKLYTNFLEVAQGLRQIGLRHLSRYHCFSHLRCRRCAMMALRMAVGDVRQRCALFPESKFFASVEQKRAGQAASLEQFTEAVLLRVTSEVAGAPASARAECAVLM